MASDPKKVQTLANAYIEGYQEIQAINARIQTLKALYDAQSPVETGTPLQGRAAATTSWVATLNNLSSNPTMDALLVDYVPTHKGDALG